jgi:hypothetical protein
MHPVGFETTISAGERLCTYALARAATGTDTLYISGVYFLRFLKLIFLLLYIRGTDISQTAAQFPDKISPLVII